MTQVSQAMKAFYDATVELGLQNKVTTFTLSDFSRTLQPSGTELAAGSDHAWGNNHLVLGGAVAGNTLYGTYPTLRARRTQTTPMVVPVRVAVGYRRPRWNNMRQRWRPGMDCLRPIPERCFR